MRAKLALFENKEIRKIYKNNKWYYSVQDVISMYIKNEDVNKYVEKLKKHDKYLKDNWSNLCININMQTKDGKIRKVSASDTVGILRIIESIQTENTDKIKMWLAKLGSERLAEINNPELAMDRMKKIYELKGYSHSWIEQREKEITTRHTLKEEWKNRGIKEEIEYKILHDEIYKSALGVDMEKYIDIKGINDIRTLPDSMTNLELALINLEEISAIYLHQKNNTYQLENIKKDINLTGKIINNTKKELENTLDINIISNENYLNLTQNK